MNSFGTRLNKVLKYFPWYNEVWMWHTQGRVSEQEVKDTINYLLTEVKVK